MSTRNAVLKQYVQYMPIQEISQTHNYMHQ